MKNAIFGSLVVAAGLCFGAANDTLISFSTAGTDRYGDGTPVLDGECYALVWTANGAAFGGFAADGSLLSAADRLVVAVSLAAGGRCPATLLEIDAADAALYEGGSFGLYLLDTRVKDVAGAVSVGGAGALANGAAGVTVNAAGKAAGGAVAGDSSPLSSSSLNSPTAVSLAEVGVYAKIDEPQIRAVKIEDAKVELKVSGLSPAAEYFVVAGAAPGAVERQLPATAAGDTFTFDQPAGNATFFRVIGARKFK